MGSRFLIAFATGFFVALATLAVAGFIVAQIATPSPRDPFRSSQFEFDLAPGWECELDGSEYVCMPPGKGPRSAIAVMAVKERGPQDTLAAYQAQLSAAKSPGVSDPTQTSVVKKVGLRQLGRHDWVEALREGSELANFDTYYLATVTAHLGILVTMSVRRDKVDDYSNDLADMLATLNIYER